MRHLRQQLRWELNQLGVPNAVLWMDRYKIEPGDVWSEVLREELNKADLFIALLSRNYIKSEWCETELSTMAARVATFEKDAQHRRIFRADKHRVPDEHVHAVLRGAQAVRFFEDDKETDREEEFFHRGHVRGDKYYDAVRKLAEAIHRRLEELGVEMGPHAQPLSFPAAASKGRTVFVAKPARDMNAQYQTLTAELTRSGYRVLPAAEADLPETGEEAQAAILTGLSDAELSIHLLGERTGIRPDGLEADVVPFQLQCAAAEAAKRPSFQRLIWAPKVLPACGGDAHEHSPRDPFQTLSRFGARLPSDQIDSDTATRFNQFVFQRLSSKCARTTKTVYVHCVHNDRQLALEVSKALKNAGYLPVIRPDPSEGTPEEREAAEFGLIAKAQHVVLCWGNASQATLLKELGQSTIAKWRSEEPSCRPINLLIGPPRSSAKTEITELGMGEEIDRIVDMNTLPPQGGLQSALIPLLE